MKAVRKTFCLLVILVVLAGLGASLVVTYPDEYRLVRQFGEIVRIVDTPGVSFKIPFVQTADSVPKALQIYDIPKSDVITKDKKSMIADAFVLWRISDPVLFTRHLNGQVAQAQARISASVFSSMKAVISNMDQTEIIENRDGKLALDISGNIGDSLSGYGIEVLAVETKSLDMPDDNKQAVYDRMISERNNIAASYTAQGNSSAQKIKNDTTKEVAVMKSEAQAEAERIKAEGEAQYMQILSGAYNDADKADFYNFVRSLDAAKASLKSGDNTLILDKSSPIAQIFYGYE
ncbi:MAG: protease modulator HflC [Clostridiales bacterium]|nr:protease modulator HflC [Clostridiales bacterium]